MDRPKEVDEALKIVADETDTSIFNTIYCYIRSLEIMIDAAYKTLNELDELV